MDEIISKIVTIIKSNVDTCANISIDKNTALITTNLLNSFSLVSLLPLFESEFKIQFDLDELEVEHFETPLKIGKLITSLQK